MARLVAAGAAGPGAGQLPLALLEAVPEDLEVAVPLQPTGTQ